MSQEGNAEKISSAEISPELLEKIRASFAELVEERVTDPNFSGPNDEYLLQIPSAIRKGEKVLSWYAYRHLDLQSALVMIGQRFRLTPDQIDELLKIFFKS